jgi:hypothetical protein
MKGIMKEAESMVNTRNGYYDSYDVYLSTEILGFALESVAQKLDVFTAHANLDADDFKANSIVAEIEADAEQRCWYV